MFDRHGSVFTCVCFFAFAWLCGHPKSDHDCCRYPVSCWLSHSSCLQLVRGWPHSPLAVEGISVRCGPLSGLLDRRGRLVKAIVDFLTFQQHASVSQGPICSDNFTCCHTDIEVADETFYLTQSQYDNTGPTSPSADPITPGAWQGSHWSVNF